MDPNPNPTPALDSNGENPKIAWFKSASKGYFVMVWETPGTPPNHGLAYAVIDEDTLVVVRGGVLRDPLDMGSGTGVSLATDGATGAGAFWTDTRDDPNNPTCTPSTSDYTCAGQVYGRSIFADASPSPTIRISAAEPNEPLAPAIAPSVVWNPFDPDPSQRHYQVQWWDLRLDPSRSCNVTSCTAAIFEQAMRADGSLMGGNEQLYTQIPVSYAGPVLAQSSSCDSNPLLPARRTRPGRPTAGRSSTHRF